MDVDTHEKILPAQPPPQDVRHGGDDRLLVTGMHLHFPGFAHLVRDGSGYRLIPEAWQHAL